jgi:hypothetical protein
MFVAAANAQSLKPSPPEAGPQLDAADTVIHGDHFQDEMDAILEALNLHASYYAPKWENDHAVILVAVAEKFTPQQKASFNYLTSGMRSRVPHQADYRHNSVQL